MSDSLFSDWVVLMWKCCSFEHGATHVMSEVSDEAPGAIFLYSCIVPCDGLTIHGKIHTIWTLRSIEKETTRALFPLRLPNCVATTNFLLHSQAYSPRFQQVLKRFTSKVWTCKELTTEYVKLNYLVFTMTNICRKSSNHHSVLQNIWKNCVFKLKTWR